MWSLGAHLSMAYQTLTLHDCLHHPQRDKRTKKFATHSIVSDSSKWSGGGFLIAVLPLCLRHSISDLFLTNQLFTFHQFQGPFCGSRVTDSSKKSDATSPLLRQPRSNVGAIYRHWRQRQGLVVAEDVLVSDAFRPPVKLYGPKSLCD